MRCIRCGKESSVSRPVTITLERNGTMIAVQDVPACLCTGCGEICMEENVAARVLYMAARAADRGSEFETVFYIE